jgi:hypothetical protein
MKSNDKLGSPLDSGILVRCFKDSGELKSGLFDPSKQGKLVPCVEIVKVGPAVKQATVGQWALLNNTVKPSTIVIKGELFYLIKEYELMYLYDEKPTMDEIYQTDNSVTKDMTPYVNVESFVDMKAKFRDEKGDLVTLKGDKITE